MKLIFLINTTSDYDTFSTLINEALKRKYKILCLHNYTLQISRPYSFPYTNLNPFKKKTQTKKAIFKKNLYQILKKNDFDFIFSKRLPPLTQDQDKEYLKLVKGKFNLIMDGIDIYDVCKNIKLYKNLQINIFLWSNFFKQKLLKFLKEFYHSSFLSIKEKHFSLHVVGHMFSKLEKNKDEIKDKYRIPKNKKVILYCPYAFDDGNVKLNDRYWKFFFSGLDTDFYPKINNKKVKFIFNFFKKTFFLFRSIILSPHKIFKFFSIKTEYKILRYLREYCNKNNFYLVVKSRIKYLPNFGYEKFGDLFIWDKQTKQCPSILQEILAISHVNISYSSNVALEASLYGIPTINIASDKDDFFDEKHFNYWSYKNHFFNYKNVVRTLDNKSFKLTMIKNDKKHYFQYINKFLGGNNSANKVFNIIKKNYDKQFN